jgi:hypothetical protein
VVFNFSIEKMNANDLYASLEAEFGKALVPEIREDGHAYYWREIKKAPRSYRLVRIKEARNGDVVEIKLAQSSLREGNDVLLPVPASNDDVAAAVHLELSLFLSK